jgi:hypothetical protein
MARQGIVTFRGKVNSHELVGGLRLGSASTALSERERECRRWIRPLCLPRSSNESEAMLDRDGISDRT